MSKRFSIDFIRSFELPSWVRDFVDDIPDQLPGDDIGFMGIAVDLLNRQLDEKAGGPFAALLVDTKSGKLLSVGVNRVVASFDPTSHAEVTAIRLASSLLGRFDHGGSATLYTTAQPCGMCLNALIWAGIGKVVIGATAEDTERITGFDEGIISDDWRFELKRRKIMLVEDVFRDEVCTAFERYVAEGGFVYNGTRA